MTVEGPYLEVVENEYNNVIGGLNSKTKMGIGLKSSKICVTCLTRTILTSDRKRSPGTKDRGEGFHRGKGVCQKCGDLEFPPLHRKDEEYV